MPHQLAVTIRAEVTAGVAGEVAALLRSLRDGGVDNSCLPFSEFTGVHFARLFLAPAATDLDGSPIPASLVYMCDVDAPLRGHLGQLAALPGLDEVFGRCADYPIGDTSRRAEWLREHLVEAAASYVHTVGRSLDQVQGEAHGYGRDSRTSSTPTGPVAPSAATTAPAPYIDAFAPTCARRRISAGPPSPHADRDSSSGAGSSPTRSPCPCCCSWPHQCSSR